MLRKIFTLLVFIALLFVVYYTVVRDLIPEIGKKHTLLEAFPENSCFIIHFKDYNQNKLTIERGPYFDNLTQLPFMKERSPEIKIMNEILTTSGIKDLYIVAKLVNAKALDFIYLVPKSDLVKLKSYFQNQDVLSTEMIGQSVEQALVQKEELNILYQDEFAVMAFNPILIEDAIVSLNDQYNLNGAPYFKDLFKENNNGVSFYMNHSAMPNIYSYLFEKDIKKKFLSNKMGEWSSFSLDFKPRIIHFTGVSNFQDSSIQYLSKVSKYENVEFSMDQILPKNTVSYIWQANGIEDTSVLSSESMSVFLDNYEESSSKGYLTLLRFKDGVSKDMLLSSTLADQGIVKGELNNYFKNILKIDKEVYLCQVRGVTVIAYDLKTVKGFLYANEANNLLSKEIEYLKFKNHISSSSNYVYYQHTPDAYDLIYPKLDQGFQKDFIQYYELIKDFETIGVELKSQGGKVYTNIFMLYNQLKHEKKLLAWEKDYKVPFSSEVSIVKNYKTKQLNILVQDESKKLLCIDEKGDLIWKKTLDGIIQSKVQEIDLYGNRKKQYIFNTDKKIYCLDRKGKIVEGFPIKLPKKIIGDLSILDYDNNKNYRFFVSCDDNKIYGFSKNGRGLRYSWPKKVGKVSAPIRYFSSGGKDYLLASTEDGKLYVMNRKGENRINPINVGSSLCSKAYVDFGKKSKILVANNLNELISIGMNGKVSKKDMSDLGIIRMSNMIYSDFDEFKGKEMLVIENRGVTGIKDDAIVFQYKFTSEIDSNVVLNYDVNEDKTIIGVSFKGQDKISLINQYGFSFEGFPVVGRKGFDIAINSNGKAVLVSYDKYGKIFMYKVD